MNLGELERHDGTADPHRDTMAEQRLTQLTWGPTYRRRRLLRTIGGVAIAGLLAGCSANGGNGNTNPTGGGAAGSVDEWLADTGNYDGAVDMTGEDAVTVEVGAQGNSGPNAFTPAAIKVSPETTVTWNWVNGYHNVVATDGQFTSGEPEQNATFRHMFDRAGTVRYYCDPHQSMGMKGAVIVTDGDSGGSQ